MKNNFKHLPLFAAIAASCAAVAGFAWLSAPAIFSGEIGCSLAAAAGLLLTALCDSSRRPALVPVIHAAPAPRIVRRHAAAGLHRHGWFAA